MLTRSTALCPVLPGDGGDVWQRKRPTWGQAHLLQLYMSVIPLPGWIALNRGFSRGGSNPSSTVVLRPCTSHSQDFQKPTKFTSKFLQMSCVDVLPKIIPRTLVKIGPEGLLTWFWLKCQGSSASCKEAKGQTYCEPLGSTIQKIIHHAL
jgi:hypothetical protein